MRQPKKWWFAVAVPAAMLATYGSFIVRMLLSGDRMEPGFLVILLVAGLLTFPGGLAGLLWGNDQNPAFLIAIILGYAVYLYLVVKGIRHPTMTLFVVLLILLTCNIIGCHTMGRSSNNTFYP